MLTVARDATYLLLSHVVQYLVLKGPGLDLCQLVGRHLGRVEHGVLAQKQLDGFVVLPRTRQHTAQLGLALETQLSIVHISQSTRKTAACELQRYSTEQLS